MAQTAHAAEPVFSLARSFPPEQKADVDFGFRIAKETSRLEIGQMVVVKSGVVLAVEAFEGTDQCLARGGKLAGKDGGAVAVKVAKLNHDMRFDLPCIGAQTLETCAASGVAVLALEAGKTLLLEQETCEQLAKENKISVTLLFELWTVDTGHLTDASLTFLPDTL